MGVRGGMLIGKKGAPGSPKSDMSGEMVMPATEVVKGVKDVSDRPRECVPLLDEVEGEPRGE